jgi:lipid-binding SYLF domain-containing protein
MKLFKFFVFAFLFTSTLLLSLKGYSQDKLKDKIVASAKVLKDFSTMKENIPQQLFEITEGIIVIPKLINAGFVLAGKRGKGVAMVKLADGRWSDPVFVTITGGSLGLQAGVQSVDLVLIFKNSETLENIGGGSFTLGGDISVTAGPIGRNSTASTDYKMEAEVYSYSRSKGLFAGISLSGSAIDIDESSNEAFYGEEVDAKTLFSESNNNSSAVANLKTTLKNLYK